MIGELTGRAPRGAENLALLPRLPTLDAAMTVPRRSERFVSRSVGGETFVGSLGVNTRSVPAGMLVQPDFWPPYMSPVVVPVSGTSMGSPLSLRTCSCPSCSHADTLPAARLAAHVDCS